MAQLKSLPDELLLDIALRLQPPDLKDLALTARQFRDIAQEALHTSISLRTHYQSLPELLRTLVTRPDLAKKVRSLQITGYRGPQQVYRSAVGYDDSWDQVVTHAIKSTHSWPIDQMKWASRVKYGDLHACIGLLLVLTDQLQNLAFCSGDNQDFMTPPSLSLTFPGIAERHAVTAPGTLLLPHLRRLSVAWGEMDRSWSTFPKLLHLELDCTGPVAWDKEPVILFHGITTLTLHRPILYEYQAANTQDLSPFFQRLPALRSLHLCFTNWIELYNNMSGGIGFAYGYYGYDNLYYATYNRERICYPGQGFTSSIIIDPLIPASHLLEELELKCTDTGDSKQIDYLRPSRSLQRFTLIKRLSIPQSILINSTPYECSPLYPFEALPPNVEYLNVADPTTAVIEWISGVLDDRSKLRSLKRISLDFDNDPKQRVKDYKEAGVQIFGRLLEAGISVHFENAIMLDASNMEPITGDRKAYCEDLRKNHIPQFLFRIWSSNSGGGSEHATNSVKEIIPHGFMKKASGSGFYDKPESELYKVVQDYYDTKSVFTSEFSSWTGSLHLALCYAGSIEEEYGPHVAIMDTHQLDVDVLVWHVPHLFKPDGLHEYLAHGPIRGIGYKAVSYKTLMSAGLAQIFPELLETDLDDWCMSLRDQMFNGPPIPVPKDNIEKSDEMKQIRSIANLYGHLHLPVATSLMCLRLRHWLGSRAEGEVALDKVANLFANTKPAKDISRGNWLCEGVVLTESPMGPHNFPDVRQWIKLLRAISERTD